MKKLLLIFTLLPQMLWAQESLWKEPSTARQIPLGEWEGLTVNRKELNPDALTHLIEEIENKGSARITLPHPTEEDMVFIIRPSHLLAKELQDKYPDIRTYKGVNSQGEMIRLDVNPDGIHATVYSSSGMISLSPVTTGSTQHVSYFSLAYRQAHAQVESFEELILDESHPSDASARQLSSDSFKKRTIGTQLRKYRIAISADGLYTRYHGGKTKALQAIVTTLNRVTGVFETDFAITFELIADNDKIIFELGNDPFEGKDLGKRGAINIQVLNDVIGFENYDIGHVLSGDGGGGVASARQVCHETKGSATTGDSTPKGDRFDIDYVAHEIGHQFGGTHTYSASCSGFYPETAYEIGRGTTIMAYAGLCIDVGQPYSDPYFYTFSIEQVLDYVVDDSGGSCATLVPIDNAAPIVNAQEGGFTIPINTPFVLKATGQDTDGDELTYCWEQLDKGKEVGEFPPGYDFGHFTREEMEELGLPEDEIEFWLEHFHSDSLKIFEGDGPLFRNFLPVSSGERYFPALDSVIAGITPQLEALPFKTREINFVVTVRDGKAGLTNELLTFSSYDQAGPFIVTSTYTEESYAGLSSLLVEWDVANTNKTPVNCQKVNILYSTDGGKNFDIVALANTANDGSETIMLPNIATSEARIMVRAADNVFFNVNDQNFSVTSTTVAAPAAPTALTGQRSNGGHSIDLSWSHTGDLENGFIIERKSASSSAFEQVGQTSVNETSFTDTQVDPTEVYEYRVAAFNATATSDYSNVLTIEAVKGTDILAFSLAEQTGDAIIHASNRTITLEVGAGTDLSALAPVIVLSDGATSTPASGETVDFTNPVTYTVTAEDGITVQDWLVTVTAKAASPEAPSNLSGSRSNETIVTLSWSDNSEAEEGFIIERRSESTAPFAEIERTTSDISDYSDTDLEAALTYEYRVAAFNSTGISAYSNVAVFQGTVLSISEFDQLDLLYPNPAKREIYLPHSLLSQKKEIVIWDTKGVPIMTTTIQESVEKLDISSLPKGLYVINISTRDQTIVRKFFKE